MIFLVDYDNVRPIDRGRGLANIVEKIVRTVGTAPYASVPRARVRLYGGWLLRSTPSRLAQALAADIAAHFPRVVVVTDPAVSVRVTTNVELAHSLECDPRSVFPNTFRVRSAPENIRSKAIPYAGCQNPAACAIGVMHTFFTSGGCPQVGCSVVLEGVLERAEQKLVDGMITADLLHLSTRATEPIAIVTSDDDLWPAVHGAVIYGAHVLHIQTHAGRTTPTYYSALVSGQYSQFSL
jgi:hypothetical protein